MQKQSEQLVAPTASLSPQQHTAYWYQAATLTERISSWPAKGAVPALDAVSRRAEAEKILQRWKAQKPFDNSTLFADRLSMDALTEQDVLALLAEPVVALQERLSYPASPGWVTELVDSLQTDHTPLPLPEQDLKQLSQQFALLQPFHPLVQKSVAHLLNGVKSLVGQYETLPFDPETILSLLLPNLFGQLGPQVSKTLVLELNIARLRGHLQGQTPQERFQYYIHLLGQREHLQPLLEEYSVLARHVLLSSQRWAECSLEFLQRLCIDWQEILLMFTPEQDPGVLTAVAGGAGDTHRGGRSVMILTFASGLRLLYKPKPLQVDLHFQELLAWLNARGSHPAFPLLKLIEKVSYGWTAFIVARSCSSEEEVARFYERQGGYLALLYALEATDFHYENVLAAGEYPFLIDLEALFHPRNHTQDNTLPLSHQALAHSVLRIALLPERRLANDGSIGIDLSGLGQIEGQLSLRPVARWEEADTDEMRLIRRRVELQGSQNCPRLHDQEVQPIDYIKHLITGFTTIYRLLITYRDELLMTWLPRFAHDEVRFVARATRLYSVLLTESFHPNLLRDALKRERFFDRLWLPVDHRPSLVRLIAAERADLLCADIPLFTTRPESRDLWTSRGACLSEFFEESSLEQVSKRLKQLSETDLRQQIWIIRASFASLAGQPVAAASADLPHLPTPSMYSSVARERLVAEARAIGDRLYASALQDEERADWIGLSWVLERDWQITTAGLDLFNGLPGILLFLSYLGQITGEVRFTALAQAGLKTLQTIIQQNQAFLDQVGIGAFTGLTSCLYLFSHLAALWNNPTLLREAEKLLPLLPGQIEKDEKHDLVDGAAGCLISLLNLFALAPSAQTLTTAVQCGEHLLAHARPMPEGLGWKAQQQDRPLSGFSHGVAGIAWSLLRLAATSGEKRFREAALAALAYERSLFSPQQRNWRDLRKRPTAASQQHDQAEPAQVPEPHYGMSWSHGAPGIALGRLVSLPYLDNAAIRAEIEIALETTIAHAFGYSHEQVGSNHSLVHGDCGNLETVLLAVQTLHTPSLHEHLERLTAQLLANIQQHGWVMGVPLNVETPGLMPGLAGIGYQCLRLAEPDCVPSVLTLAPPAIMRL